MSRFDYDTGQSLFFDEERFTFPLSGSVTSGGSLPTGNRSFANLHVELAEQERAGAKPHVTLLDSDGHVVLDVPARATGAYGRLTAHAGEPVESLRWRRKGGTSGAPYMECWIRYADYDDEETEERQFQYEQLFLDTETTGLDPARDEILQLAIADGEGRVVWDRKYKPTHHTAWPEAQTVHHISPESVRNCPAIQSDLDEIQSILDSAEHVYAFNAPFDFAFLGRLGLHCDRERTHDTMREYARKAHGREYIKLTEAAKEVGYSYKPHDAKTDCIATMQVQRSVDGKPVMTSDDFAKRDMKPCDIKAMRRKWIVYWVLLAVTVVFVALVFVSAWMLIPAALSALFTWSQAHSNELQAQINEAAGLPAGRDQRRLLRSKSKHAR